MHPHHHALPAPDINARLPATPTSIPPEGWTPSPEISYFSPRPPRTQARPQPSTNFIASLSTFPRTPPINLQTCPSPEPQAQSRQDQSYFAPRSNRSQARHARITSPLDISSNPSCKSPGLSSGGSFHSSDTGRSPCSYSSSEFLTPPIGQPDTDNPPYKTRRTSSDSLTMARKLRQANTTPYDKPHKRGRRHRKRQNCEQKKIKMHDHQTRSCWWLSAGCQIAPTAPPGQKQLCDAYIEKDLGRMTRGGNPSNYGSLVSGLRSKPAPSLVTRRWSSVEIGAHQIPLESILPFKPNTSEFPTSSPQTGHFSSNNLGQRFRSTTFTCGAIDPDIVHTVRQRLTLRKIPHEEIATPASITLRRASGESRQSIFGNGASGSTLLVPQSRSLNQRRPSAAYLITTEDIDSITELIQANLKRGYNSNCSFVLHSPSPIPPSDQRTPSPSITNKGVLPTNGSTAELALTIAEVQPINARLNSPFDFLQIVSPNKTNDIISRKYSQKSFHEIIWEGGGSPRSANSVTDEDDVKHSARLEFQSEPSTPVKNSPHQDTQSPESFFSDKEDAFDPKNAEASISEWSWRCPQEEIGVVMTPSESDSYERSPQISNPQIPQKFPFVPRIPALKGIPNERLRHSLRSAASETTLHDVVSFPPLPPRKATNDWCSPLPSMEISTPLTMSRSLYDVGIDVSLGPSSSKIATPKSCQISWVRSAEVSHVPSLEFDPLYEIRSKSLEINSDGKTQRQSVIKALPNVLARTGDLSAVGSSIGASSGERRKSSSPSIQRRASPRLCEPSAVKFSIGSTSSGRGSPLPQIRRKISPRPINVVGTGPSPGGNVGEEKNFPTLRSPHETLPLSKTTKTSPRNTRPEGKRRSSSPRIQRVRTIDNVHKGERDAPVSKWRAPTPCPTPRSPSPSEYDTRELLFNTPDVKKNSDAFKRWLG